MRSRRELLNEDDIYNPSKHIRMPVCICIEATKDMALYYHELEDATRKLGESLERNDNTRSTVDLAIFLYTNTIKDKYSRDFKLLDSNDLLDFKSFDEEPDLYSCFLDAITRLQIRRTDYEAQGIDYYQQTIVVISTGKSLENEKQRMKAIKVAKERAEAGTSIIPIKIGNEKNDCLRDISVDGECFSEGISGIDTIFEKLKKSMEYLSQSSSNARKSLLSQAVGWEEVLRYVK